MSVAVGHALKLSHVHDSELFRQWYEVIVPSLSLPLPESVTIFVGNVIDLSETALDVGTRLAAWFTVICTVEVALAPFSAVHFNSKVYTPGTKPES